MLTDEQLQHYRDLLTTERARVAESTESLDESNSIGQTDETEENGLETHPGDQGTDTFLRERDMALGEHEHHVLDEIDAALARLDAGTYGSCNGCGGEIPAERLDALPWASTCVSCSEQRAGSSAR